MAGLRATRGCYPSCATSDHAAEIRAPISTDTRPRERRPPREASRILILRDSACSMGVCSETLLALTLQPA